MGFRDDSGTLAKSLFSFAAAADSSGAGGTNPDLCLFLRTHMIEITTTTMITMTTMITTIAAAPPAGRNMLEAMPLRMTNIHL